MTDRYHNPIADVPLLPRRVPQACAVHKGKFDAEAWIVCPDGLAISRVCRPEAEWHDREFRSLGWTLAPIYHDTDNDDALPRSDAARLREGDA